MYDRVKIWSMFEAEIIRVCSTMHSDLNGRKSDQNLKNTKWSNSDKNKRLSKGKMIGDIKLTKTAIKTN